MSWQGSGGRVDISPSLFIDLTGSSDEEQGHGTASAAVTPTAGICAPVKTRLPLRTPLAGRNMSRRGSTGSGSGGGGKRRKSTHSSGKGKGKRAGHGNGSGTTQTTMGEFLKSGATNPANMVSQAHSESQNGLQARSGFEMCFCHHDVVHDRALVLGV